MIVRISGEGQFTLADSESGRLNELERSRHRRRRQRRRGRVRASFATLLDFVRSTGERIGDDELEGSDVILPPSDTSLEEAAAEFTGEGLIPD